MGSKVFESNDYKLGWDGRFKSVQAPPETYMYHAEYKIRFTDRTPIQKVKRCCLINSVIKGFSKARIAHCNTIFTAGIRLNYIDIQTIVKIFRFKSEF